MADNTEFCDQIGAALAELGTSEVLSCMARTMAVIAQKQGSDIEFNCDLAVVSVERKLIKLNG
ncbi:hypothetical protein CJF42_06135 [Pseudoalteromonas sp. NBT06-2]|uniref:hypothetical protein n=1 Tax=Pseudoalteromonas sp. NBT06-2 TaxID=2025950 RepID=UPI000BA6AD05|nr:hypothetical protein [Pseudoalteromonas sp. NBT06-2]PAJ75225.1 hypothetical protein CJF42_06135 [Pseudoalteromonas sp. NBT06-2]